MSELDEIKEQLRVALAERDEIRQLKTPPGTGELLSAQMSASVARANTRVWEGKAKGCAVEIDILTSSIKEALSAVNVAIASLGNCLGADEDEHDQRLLAAMCSLCAARATLEGESFKCSPKTGARPVRTGARPVSEGQ